MYRSLAEKIGCGKQFGRRGAGAGRWVVAVIRGSGDAGCVERVEAGVFE